MASDEAHTRAVGPYLLQKTLGKGQTGLVKLGVHCSTGKTVAVKIINREKLSKSVLMKVEREIAIMKLIDHPHVLGLHDVYENNVYLYLVLEHVSGGELFDYLVRKGRLSEREARRFFKQIVSAVDFCHKHAVCHRDLKPENLLLDDQRNIKVADFGMASLQVSGALLETSCGSPHYACPEVIRGENYDGRKADAWSLGVILFALLVGSLPFDDDNLRVLLEKVKRGRFSIPAYVPNGAQELIRGMIDVNPKTRLTLDHVIRHPWFQGSLSLDGVLEPVLPMGEVVQTCPLTNRDDIDPDVFNGMTSLGCFRDKHKLVDALLAPDHNEEKIIYFLLLERKDKRPSLEDDARVAVNDQRDPPRKRIDSQAILPPSFQLQRARSHSIGSAGLDTATPPRSPRLMTGTPPGYTPTGYYSYYSPQPQQRVQSRKVSMAGHECQTLPIGATLDGGGGPSPWKRRLSTTLRTIVSSPKFGRRRFEGSQGSPEASAGSSPQTVKRSWFASLKVEKEREEVVVVYRDKTFKELKDLLVHSFAVVNIIHEELEENTYKCKYEKSTHAETKGKPVLKKKVKFTIRIVPIQRRGSTVSADHVNSIYDGQTHSLQFQQTAGPTRRFYRVCEKIQTIIADPGIINPLLTEFTDQDTRSGSSDDTLTLHSTNGVAHDSGKGSSASVEVLVHAPSNPPPIRPSILRDNSSDSEDDLLDS